MGQVTVTRQGAVAWVSISNVAKHNAMSASMWRQLADITAQVQTDAYLRVIVLRGDGDKAFVSGADISEFGERAGSKEASDAYSQAVDAAERSLTESSKPVIAMINGICMGGGLGLAVSSDLRYASRNTRFRMPAARLGLGYGLANMRRIVDVVGKARAAELFYTAHTFDGSEAERIGLVHDAVHADALQAHVQQVADMIAENAPLTIRAAKLALDAVDRQASVEQIDKVKQALADCANSDDYTEGRTAFMEKRPAKFVGS